MTANQLPGHTLEPVPPSATFGDTRWTALQKFVELSRLWAIGQGKAGVTGDPQDDEFTLWQKFNHNVYNLTV